MMREEAFTSRHKHEKTKDSSIGSMSENFELSQDNDMLMGVEQMKDYRQIKENIVSFYDTTEDTPMKFRILIFRQQFKELSTLQHDQLIKLIQIYDKNLNKSHELNSSQFAIIGSLFLYVGRIMLNASSVFQIKYK